MAALYLQLCMIHFILLLLSACSGALTRLAFLNESSATDRTGYIMSFSDVGLGVKTSISGLSQADSAGPLVCFSDSNIPDLHWLFPNGSAVKMREAEPENVTDIGMFSRIINYVSTVGIALYRGPTHQDPDGEHCCVKANTTQRKCITFTLCPTLTPAFNQNVAITYDAGTNIATYRCDSGYKVNTISGNNSRTCEETGSGEWSGSEPDVVCEILPCSSLSNPANGNVIVPNPANYEHIAMYNCNTGYFLSGNGTQQCAANGEWTGEPPTCLPIDCRELSDPANGTVQTTSGTTFMSVAVYSCNIGYSIVGSDNRTCEENENWTSSAPTCQPIDCGSLFFDSNGQVIVSGTTFTSVALYTCDSGYTLNGAKLRNCQANGMWSEAVPTCEPVDCGPPPSIANGVVQTLSGTIFGKAATYVCNMGYTLNGFTDRLCQANGNWSGIAPVCKLIPISSGLITNNSAVLLMTILDSALICRTELSTCCRDQDNPNGPALGKWIGPNGNSLPVGTEFGPRTEEGFYVTRNFTAISLHYHGNKSGAELGAYCCIIPRAGDIIQTFCMKVQHDQVSLSPPSSECSYTLIALEILLAASVMVIIVLVAVLFATVIKRRMEHRKSVVQQQHQIYSVPDVHPVQPEVVMPMYEDLKNMRLHVPSRTFEFTNCPIYNSTTSERNVSNVHENEVPNASPKDEVPNVSREYEVPNVCREDEVPNVSHEYEVPNINREDEIPNIFREDELPNVCHEYKLLNVSYEDNIPTNVSCEDEVPNASCEDEISNVSHKDQVPNVGYHENNLVELSDSNV